MSGILLNGDADRRLRGALAAIIVLSLAFVAVVAALQYRHRADIAAFRQLQQQGSPAFRAAHARFEADTGADRLLLHIRDADTGRWRPRRKDELLQSLFPGWTPTTIPSPPGGAVGWVDPVRGLAFYFGFDANGEMSSYGVGPLPAVPPEQPWLLRALRDLDPLRRQWVGAFTVFTVGPMLWIALFVATLVWRRARLPLAYAQFAVAWLCFLGWPPPSTANPRANRPRRRFSAPLVYP